VRCAGGERGGAAHRWACTGHRGRGKRRRLRSILDDIPGIGPRRRRALLKALGSVDGVVAASVDDIAKVEGVGRVMALKIKAALGDAAVDAPAPDDAVDEVPALDDTIDPPAPE